MRASPRSRPEAWLSRRGGWIELLRLPAALYGGAVALRHALYDRGWLRSRRVDVPVISVGNLRVGGTGKTPFVAWLAARLEARGLRPHAGPPPGRRSVAAAKEVFQRRVRFGEPGA